MFSGMHTSQDQGWTPRLSGMHSSHVTTRDGRLDGRAGQGWTPRRRGAERRVGQVRGSKGAGAARGSGWREGARVGYVVLCACRGVGARGRLSRTVAMSLAREDHTTTPRWRARAKNCVLRRGRPVSRIGQKNQKSATCEPSTLRRGAWSRPTCGQRSACTSSPRRARTWHWKWAG